MRGCATEGEEKQDRIQNIDAPLGQHERPTLRPLGAALMAEDKN